MPKFYLITGIPGSGKSTLAKKIIAEHPGTVCYEADMFFERNGEYQFNRNLLFAAHKWCQAKTEAAMKAGKDVIVSNTSLVPRERYPYLALIKKYHYDYEVIHCTGEYQNIHNCPEETLIRMKQRYQPFTQAEYDLIEE